MLNKIIEKYSPKLVSFIGAGGKSSLINMIAAYFRDSKKVLISSTIDIKRIDEDKIDLIDYDFQEDYSLCKTYENGIYVISEGLTNDNKLKGLNKDTISTLSECFDLSLIECDYTTGRNLKAWRDEEPIIPCATNLLVYVLDIQMVGKRISVDYIHNVDVFIDITGKKIGDTIELCDITKLIKSKESNFEALNIRRLMFINKVERTIDKMNTELLFKEIKDLGFEIISYGSIKNNSFTLLKENLWE